MSLVAEDLALGRLVRAAPPDWDIPMEIRLVRPQQEDKTRRQAAMIKLVTAGDRTGETR